MSIADDHVDQELVDRPSHWDIHLLRKFITTFGLISSLFEYVTFAALLFLLRAAPEPFRTAWFVESMLTEMFIILAMRTRRWLFRSTPGKLLGLTILVIATISIIIPYLPISRAMGFVPLPLSIMMVVLAISTSYLVTLEVAKHIFFRKALARGPEVA